MKYLTGKIPGGPPARNQPAGDRLIAHKQDIGEYGRNMPEVLTPLPLRVPWR